MKRLVCPNGLHEGILAPGRMKLTDLRRFCLDCSLESGFLTERVSPARERRRAKRRQQARAKLDGVKLMSTSDGLDVRNEIARLRDLPCWGEWGVAGAIRRVRVSVFGGRGTSARGHCTPGRVHVTAGNAPGWQVSLVLVHELVHAAYFARGLQNDASYKRRRIHDQLYHVMLEEAAADAFELKDGEREFVRKEYLAASGARRAYSMDEALVKVIGGRSGIAAAIAA